ncbi:MAG: carbohydrate kinase family protein [bacterium]
MSDTAEKFDVIAIGDTTQDIFLEMSDAIVQCDLNGENCRISFNYADKIVVDKKTDVPAVGNAANHAVGVARLGLHSAVYTMVGDDEQGQRARHVFAENNVDTRYVVFDKLHGTNLSMVINYRGERTIFVYHEPRDYELPELADTKWIYLTSASGKGVLRLHEQVLKYLESNQKVKMAFNPGTHQMHLGLEKLKPLLARTDVLFLNREESAEVLGVKTRGIDDLAKGFHDLGVKTMVLTDGPDGSYVSGGGGIRFLKIFRGPVVERTGAGDSYGAGFLSAIIRDKPVEEAMLWGNGNSTSVLQYIGARQGLLDEEAVSKIIEENSDIIVEKYNNVG